MLGHPERNRAEPLGFSGKLDVGEPFEQDPNRDLTMEATDPINPIEWNVSTWALTATTQLIDATDRAHGGRRQHNQRPTVQQEPSVSTGLGVSGRGDAISSIARSSAWQPMDG